MKESMAKTAGDAAETQRKEPAPGREERAVDDAPENDPAERDNEGEAGAERAPDEEKIKAAEADKLEDVRERIRDEAGGESEEMRGEERLAPAEAFAKYRDPETIKAQEDARPAGEKRMNRLLESRFVRAGRQERADETLEGVTGLLEDVRESGRTAFVLDLGCGQGEILRAILDFLQETDLQAKAVGVDRSTYVAPEKLKDDMAFMRVDVLDTGLADGSVDLLNCHYLFQALPEEKQRDVLAEMRRLLAPDGRVLFMDVVKRGGIRERIDKFKHQALNRFAPYNIRTEEEWKAFLEENGFEVVERADVLDRCAAFLLKAKEKTVEAK